MSANINNTFEYITAQTEHNNHSIRCDFNRKVWINLPHTYQQKVNTLVSALALGVPFTRLGGKKIKCNQSLIRFRIGRNHRLLLKTDSQGKELRLLNRQGYEMYF